VGVINDYKGMLRKIVLLVTSYYYIFVVMSKNKRNTYRQVNELPVNAIKVADYAKQWPCNTSYLYKLVSTNKNISKFEIVDFQGINFVIPN